MFARQFRLIPLMLAAVALVAVGRRVLASPSSVYVSAAWTSKNPGDTVSATINGSTANHTIGTDAFATISAGVNAVASGGNVYVLAGTYNEFPDVQKSVHLYGQQLNVDARTRTFSNETILNNSIAIEADNVELNGFTVQGGDLVNDWTGAGIYTSPQHGGYTIRYNLIQNSIMGVYLNSIPASPANTVCKNLIRNNNYGYGVDFNDANGNGIYTDFGLTNTTITQNKFTGHLNASIVIQAASSITVSSNSIVNDSTVAIYTSTGVSLTSNTIGNASGAGVYLGGGNNGTTLTSNWIYNASNVGIGINDEGWGANQNFTAHLNNIFNNGVGITIASRTYTQGVGLYVASGAHSTSPQADATCNWWGSTTGPFVDSTNPLNIAAGEPANAGGTGNQVVGLATYNPWINAIDLTSQFSVTLLQTYANPTTRTYLQVVRVTNNGPFQAVGETNLVVDYLNTVSTTLVNSTGTWTGACLPPVPSPEYQLVASGAANMLPGQSQILTLKFTQTLGTTPAFNYNSPAPGLLGGNSAVKTRILAAGAY